jgi:type VI secretion system secreted protein Hcp
MAVDMTINIDGIKGESKLKGHEEEIDVLSFSWGMSQTGTFSTGGGGGAGKVNIHDLSFTKWVDKATPELMMACSNGKHIPKAVLTVRKAGEKPLEYQTITLEKLLISSVTHGGSGGEDRHTENVTLNFAKVKVEYQEQDDKGGPKGGKVTYAWDVEQNVKQG